MRLVVRKTSCVVLVPKTTSDTLLLQTGRMNLSLTKTTAFLLCFFISPAGSMNPIWPASLRDKLEDAGVNELLAAWTAAKIPNRPEDVTPWNCASVMGVSSSEAPWEFLLPSSSHSTHQTSPTTPAAITSRRSGSAIVG